MLAESVCQVRDDKLCKVCITPDLSYQERIHQKSLRSELRKCQDAGELALNEVYSYPGPFACETHNFI